jgi:copper(I)-binding protein
MARALGRWGAAAVLTVPLCGCAIRARKVEVRDARAFEALKGGTGALYATILNPTDSADRLDSVTSPASPTISAHDSREVNGLVTMVPMDHPAIAAHDSLVFTPGAAHLMLEELPRDLKAGDSVPATFWLHRAGPRSVAAIVRPYGS